MKRTTKILIGIGVLGGLVGANMWLRKSKATKAAENAPESTTTGDTTSSKDTDANKAYLAKVFGNRTKPKAPKTVGGYSKTFRNRVYTKVLDFYGVKVSSWQPTKKLVLYKRVFNKLVAKNINPNTASLGQIGPVIKEIAKEGFPFDNSNTTPATTSSPPPRSTGGFTDDPRAGLDREDWA